MNMAVDHPTNPDLSSPDSIPSIPEEKHKSD
jgi:hypothetical protein